MFGDIGTSPLYTLKECLHSAGGHRPAEADLYGVLSLSFWALTMVVTVKYLTFITRADNHGEGGIFALLALVPEQLRAAKPGGISLVALFAVMGAALLYGDGVITPAISVLSAVEGLAVADPGWSHVVVPLSCAILVGLFALQSRGTGTVGSLFGPVMAVWFVTIGGLGLYHISLNPEILLAISPHHAWGYFARHGWPGICEVTPVVFEAPRFERTRRLHVRPVHWRCPHASIHHHFMAPPVEAVKSADPTEATAEPDRSTTKKPGRGRANW